MEHVQNLWLNANKTKQDIRYECCGCSACANVCNHSAISMKEDEEGFQYPMVDETKCVGCGLCSNVCPVTNECQSKEPYIKTFAGYSIDEKVMMNCTSGGFATTLSKLIIKRGGLVYGVRFTDSFTHTEYVRVYSEEELSQLANSKYIQSEKGDIFKLVKQDLTDSKLVLFVGCPCDVVALKRFLHKECDNLLTLELVCMGVTSHKVADDYKAWTEKKHHSDLVGLNMRSKMRGWFVPHLEEHFENGKIVCSTLFGTYIGYGFQVFNRPSCFKCQYRDTTGVADIRVGDFWGIKDTDEFWNPNGVSGIYVRSQKGLDWVLELKELDFRMFETDYILATRSNMSSYKNKPIKYQLLRDKFADVYINRHKGLVAACMTTASISFFVKHYVPDSIHGLLKKTYHILVDKKRN